MAACASSSARKSSTRCPTFARWRTPPTTSAARAVGAATIEQLQDAARTAGSSLHDAVKATSGKGGANLAAFVQKIDAMRAETEGLTLREIIEVMLQRSGLVDHYKAERDGSDRA